MGTKFSAPSVAGMQSTSVRRRGVVLVTMCIGLFLVQLDVTVVAVALPSVGATLHAGVSGLQWVVDGYSVTFAALLLAGGTLSDRYGHRRLAVAGLLAFAAGSAACGFAPVAGVLVAARAVQGIGAAMLLPATLAVITHAYPGERERARAIGVWTAVAGLSLPAGPLVGGLLIAGPGWRWAFLLNLPIIAAALVPVLTVVPKDRPGVPMVSEDRPGVAAHPGAPVAQKDRPGAVGRPDVPGMLLGAATLAACVLGLIEGGRDGWASPLTLVELAAAVVLGFAFVRAQRRAVAPMLPLELFRDRRFTVANGTALAMNLVGIGLVFVTTLYLQDVQHRPPLAAGLALMPVFVPTVVLAAVAGRVVARFGARPPAVAALLMGAVGMGLLVLLDVRTPYPQLLPALMLTGASMGLLATPLVSTAVAAVPRQRAGLAGGVNNAARQTGGALGIALFGTFAGSTADPQGFVSGLHVVGVFGAALFAVAATVVALSLGKTARPEEVTGREGAGREGGKAATTT